MVGDPDAGAAQDPAAYLDRLREKWVEVPVGAAIGTIRTTTDLLKLSDAELLDEWESARRDITEGEQFSHRGWYHRLYADAVSGKKVLDIGCGFAVDSITFAQSGARVTFVDIVETNIKLAKRLCGIMGLTDVDFLFLEEMDALKALDRDFDVIMAMGSLHHAPIDVVRPEIHELLRHLKTGGRWLQLAYPRSRWVREGEPPFGKWGEITDGKGTPWAEWYDLDKLLSVMAPHRFDTVLCREFHRDNFIWFDLLYRGLGSGGSAA